MLNLASGDAQLLLTITSGSSLAWSPDGRQLALFGILAYEPEYQIHIIDVLTGEVTYTGTMNWDSYTPADPNSPILSWGFTFPVIEAGLDSCTAPPK